MVKLSLLFFFQLSALIAISQQGAVDSLTTVLATVENDRERVDVLCELADKYLTSEPQQAKKIAQEALVLSEKIGYETGIALALNRLGEYEFRQSNYAKAIELTSRSLHLAEDIKDSTMMSLAYRVLGNINTIGLKRYDSALHYQLKAFTIHKKQKDYLKIASFCGSITWIYAITNTNLDEAHQLVNRGIFLSDSLHHPQFLSYNYNSKGLIFMKQGKFDSAHYFIDQSSATSEITNDKTLQAYNKRIKGTLYLAQRNYGEAIKFFKAALAESKILNIRELEKRAYEGLAKSYSALNNYQLAYENLIRQNQLKDSLLNIEIAQKALITELEFEESKRETKINELEKANEQASREKNIYLLLFISGFIFMTIVVLLIVRNNRQREKAAKLLNEKSLQIADQYQKLKEVNETKNKLFSIVSHDLRGPIVSLKSMLGLVVRDEVTGQEFQNFAPQLNKQVISISEMLENLLQWSRTQLSGWTHTPEQIEVYGIVKSITFLFSDLAKEKNIEVVNNIKYPTMIFGDINQVQLIIRNLIHNGIKFTKEGGQIILDAVEESDFVRISVTDDGIGIKPNLIRGLFEVNKNGSEMGTQGEPGAGLGLHLSAEMAQQNGGRIEVSSQEGKGTTFNIFLPKITAQDKALWTIVHNKV